MKTNCRFITAFLCCVLILFTILACNPQPKSVGEEHNKAIVRQYFHEILDEKQYDKMPEVLTPTVVMHRPGLTLTYIGPIQIAFEKALSPHIMETTIQEIIASGDYVSVRLSHRLTYSSQEAFMQSRLGRIDVRGKTVEWDAMAMFRFESGKIAEEWVSNDELGQLMQIGTLELAVKGN